MHPSISRYLRRVRPAFVAQALKGFLGIEREIVETDAGRFWIDPVSHFGGVLLDEGHYEPATRAILEAQLPQGGVFVDIGANEGYFSVVAGRIASRVVCVEPQTRLAPVLRRNFELNEINNVTVEHVAISSEKGRATFHLSNINTGSSALQRPTKYKLPTETVELTTLADLFLRNGLEHVDVMKIDIEGSENEAIFGSPEIFSEQMVANIILELHPVQLAQKGKTELAICQFLESCGYIREGDILWKVGPKNQ